MKPEIHDILTLKEWLAIATHGLVPVAQERIKLEIEVHYGELVAARIASGMTQQDAESAAILELGEPSSAAKEFRKSHLTTDERKRIEHWLKLGRSNIIAGWLYACLIMLYCFLLWYYAASAKHPSILDWFAFSWSVSMFVAIISANLVLRRMCRSKTQAREFVTGVEIIGFFSYLALGSAIFSIQIPSHGILWWILTCLSIALPGIVALVLQEAYRRRKFRKFGAPEYFVPIGR